MNPAAVLPFVNLHTTGPAEFCKQPGVPPPEAVRTQLSRILESDGFARAKRMRRFLEFVVEETLAGRAGQLHEYKIGMAVFKRDESFEPGLDPIVRNDARRLRQKLAEYYQQHHIPEGQVVIEIPKGGYVPVFRSTLHHDATKLSSRYQLSIKLVRVSDGTEILAINHEFSLA